MSRPGWRGLIASLRSLRGPLEFEPELPSIDGEAYAPRARWRHSPRLADIYLPEGPGPHPSVMLVHGGGFIIDGRRMKPMQGLSTALVRAGYVVVSLDYRKVGRGGGRLRGADDVHKAMCWWMRSAPQYGADPARVAAVGLSAGGALMMMASERPLPQPLAMRVSVFGLYDFASLQGALGRVFKLAVLRGASPDEYSPAGQLRSTQPLVMLHGTGDRLVPIEQARAVLLRRRARLLPVELVEVPGAPHGFFNLPGRHARAGLEALMSTLEESLVER